MSVKPSRKIKKGDLRQKKAIKASRENPAPPNLKDLIELVNLIPWGRDKQNQEQRTYLPTVSRLEIEAQVLGLQFPAHLNLIRQEVERLPLELREYIGLFPAQPAEFDDEVYVQQLRAAERYEFVAQGQRLLSALAERDLRNLALPYAQVQLVLNKENKLDDQPSLLLSCVKGVDPNRIRQCSNESCLNIFWANHSNKQYCSEECGNAERNRQYRKRYPEEIKQRRYETAEAKEKALKSVSKTAKQTKGKKHGS